MGASIDHIDNGRPRARGHVVLGSELISLIYLPSVRRIAHFGFLHLGRFQVSGLRSDRLRFDFGLIRYFCSVEREMGSSGFSWKLADHPKLPKGKTVAVVVLDGWGEAKPDQYNCIHIAETPTMDSLKKVLLVPDLMFDIINRRVRFD